MQDYVIQFSMDDVIGILESAPVRPDLVSGITIAQIMNRAPMAHLSIERALKSLLLRNGLDIKQPEHRHHNLHTHLKTLRKCDADTAEYLDSAFDAAVQFYGLNPNCSELNHLGSLSIYLSTTGTDAAFQTMRYWELDQSPDELVGRMWLPIHLEFLRALREVYLSGDRARNRTVVDRVEMSVRQAMSSAIDLAYAPGSVRETEVKAYIAWLRTHASFRCALTEAVRSRFRFGNEFMNQVVAQAYSHLQQSRDPAVLYLTERVDVLPRQSRDVIPGVEWIGPIKERHGRVSTPSGHCLGFIDRSADGVWHITPMRDGAVGVAARAETQTDARCYLAQLLSAPANLTIGELPTTARLIGEEHSRIQLNHLQDLVEHATNEQVISRSHKLEFWSTDHAIEVGHEITVEVRDGHQTNIIHVLEGQVSDVEDHVVYVVGHDYLVLATPGDPGDSAPDDDN